MKPIEIQNLDQFLRPLQVDGVSTGIELSTEGLRITAGDLGLKSLTAESARINGDVNVDGNLTVTDTSTGRGNISLPSSQIIKGNETVGNLTIDTEGIVIDSFTYASVVGADKDSGIALVASSGKDSFLSFNEGATNRWRIGHDATDNSLKIDAQAAVGGNTFLELSATALTVPNGDIVAGDDIAVAATGKLSLDGIGGHTYIHEASADDLEVVVGGDTMATFDEANDRITMAATKHTSALADGTEFSATDSAYAGMILGYTRIFNLSSTIGHNNITVNNSSMTVLQTAQGTDVKVQFIVPPSGNVEIECTFWSSFSSRGAKFSLSDNATYNEIAFNYTYDADWTIFNDETDHHMHRVVFGVTGLTAGTDTTYYLGGLASSTFASILHGKNRSQDAYYPPIIMKATALPATITTGE